MKHRLKSIHDFDCDNIKILDKEKVVLFKRLISEMIHIQKQKHDLNLQNDILSLDLIYEYIRKILIFSFIFYCLLN